MLWTYLLWTMSNSSNNSNLEKLIYVIWFKFSVQSISTLSDPCPKVIKCNGWWPNSTWHLSITLHPGTWILVAAHHSPGQTSSSWTLFTLTHWYLGNLNAISYVIFKLILVFKSISSKTGLDYGLVVNRLQLDQTKHITVMSHEHHGMWNHWQLSYLFNSSFRLVTQKISKLYITGPL